MRWMTWRAISAGPYIQEYWESFPYNTLLQVGLGRNCSKWQKRLPTHLTLSFLEFNAILECTSRPSVLIL